MTTSEPIESIPTDADNADVPQPTYAPAGMALGIMLLLWGITTLWIASAVGVSLMAWALGTWIGEIRRQAVQEAKP